MVKGQIPYIVILGDKEVENNNISVRLRNSQQINNVSLADFMEQVSEKIRNRSLDL